MNNDDNIDHQQLNKRGKYTITAPATKLLIAKQAVREGVKPVLEKHPRLNLNAGTVGYWANKWKYAQSVHGYLTYNYLFTCIISVYINSVNIPGIVNIGRDPTAEECGFVPAPKKQPLLGAYEKEIRETCEALRGGGSVVNGRVLSSVITSVLL